MVPADVAALQGVSDTPLEEADRVPISRTLVRDLRSFARNEEDRELAHSFEQVLDASENGIQVGGTYAGTTN